MAEAETLEDEARRLRRELAEMREDRDRWVREAIRLEGKLQEGRPEPPIRYHRIRWD